MARQEIIKKLNARDFSEKSGTNTNPIEHWARMRREAILGEAALAYSFQSQLDRLGKRLQMLESAVEEEDGATEGGRNALEEARAGIGLLREKPGFRRFIIAGTLLLSVPLAIPFYTLYARELTGSHEPDFPLAVFERLDERRHNRFF